MCGYQIFAKAFDIFSHIILWTFHILEPICFVEKRLSSLRWRTEIVDSKLLLYSFLIDLTHCVIISFFWHSEAYVAFLETLAQLYWIYSCVIEALIIRLKKPIFLNCLEIYGWSTLKPFSSSSVVLIKIENMSTLSHSFT